MDSRSIEARSIGDSTALVWLDNRCRSGDVKRPVKKTATDEIIKERPRELETLFISWEQCFNFIRMICPLAPTVSGSENLVGTFSLLFGIKTRSYKQKLISAEMRQCRTVRCVAESVPLLEKEVSKPYVHRHQLFQIINSATKINSDKRAW